MYLMLARRVTSGKSSPLLCRQKVLLLWQRPQLRLANLKRTFREQYLLHQKKYLYGPAEGMYRTQDLHGTTPSKIKIWGIGVRYAHLHCAFTFPFGVCSAETGHVSARTTAPHKFLDDATTPSDHRKQRPLSRTAMKAARGFTLGLQLFLAASAAAFALGQADGIPEVGIGSVHPLCNPSQEECISSDEQVQDEIIAGLEAEDKVTGAWPCL